MAAAAEDPVPEISYVHIPLTGLAFGLVFMSAAGIFISILAVGMRVWLRGWAERGRNWGWDDTTCVLGLICYIVACAYAILAAIHGLGAPDEFTSVRNENSMRTIEYYQWFEVAYLFAIASIKTSVCITILRIATSPIHRYIVWAVLIFCNVAYAAGIIYLFTICHPVRARWDPEAGSCPIDFLMRPMGYTLMTIGVITDAACALVPISIVWHLQMPQRLKIRLMIVLSLGILAAIFSAARYPFCQFLPESFGNLYVSAWIPLFSICESTVGLVGGSLPAIGSRLHIFGTTKSHDRIASDSARMGDRTFGGTPFYSAQKGKELNLTPRDRGHTETRIWSNSQDLDVIRAQALTTIHDSDDAEILAAPK